MTTEQYIAMMTSLTTYLAFASFYACIPLSIDLVFKGEFPLSHWQIRGYLQSCNLARLGKRQFDAVLSPDLHISLDESNWRITLCKIMKYIMHFKFVFRCQSCSTNQGSTESYTREGGGGGGHRKKVAGMLPRILLLYPQPRLRFRKYLKSSRSKLIARLTHPNMQELEHPSRHPNTGWHGHPY